MTEAAPAWAEKYTHCQQEGCTHPVTGHVLEVAMRRFEQQYCSMECRAAADLKRYACCDKATTRHCVCYYSTDCPDHGVICNGIHD